MPESDMYLEIFKWLLTIFTLLITWGIGQQILVYWDGKKKKRELDIATINQFQQLYGEFKTIWRLWRAYLYNSENNNSKIKSLPPPEARYSWELLDRAARAEGNVEAILVKIATERRLDAKNSSDWDYSGRRINNSGNLSKRMNRKVFREVRPSIVCSTNCPANF